MQLAQRYQSIAPFYVLDMVRAAAEQQRAWTAQGRRMIHLSVGEPDFVAPPPVVEAAERAMRDGRTQYTLPAGLPELRERIAAHYASAHGVKVDPDQVFVTAGASGALNLLTLLLFNPGDEVLLPDPSYACNKNFLATAGALARAVPATAEERFQLSAAKAEAAWTPRTRGVLLASPSNPTGTSIARDELARIAALVRERGGYTLVDEIYLGLSYDPAFGHTALTAGDDVITLNSFSKYFQMTGWRLGWIVAPKELIEPLTRLAGNLYICPSTVAQHAAVACFAPESLAEYERRRAEFQRRRDTIVPALQSLGLRVPVMPDGAFYVWVDCSAYSDDSWAFCLDVMRETGVVMVPGKDFSEHQASRYLRVSYANSLENLQEAVHRLRGYLGQRQAA